MPRVFFALQPTLDQNAALVSHVAPLVAQLEAKPAPPENLHATLCFIGVVEPERLDALRAVAASIRGHRAMLLFDTLEFWEVPKILCATASEPSRPALRLAVALGEAALEAGFTPDIKPFRVHLTMARKVRVEAAAVVPFPLPLSPPLRVHCDRFVLMQSRREEGRSIYSVIGSWPLYADASE
jgi:RNA 2',3'-cyclic 3'-phosphodiesterase